MLFSNPIKKKFYAAINGLLAEAEQSHADEVTRLENVHDAEADKLYAEYSDKYDRLEEQHEQGVAASEDRHVRQVVSKFLAN